VVALPKQMAPSPAPHADGVASASPLASALSSDCFSCRATGTAAFLGVTAYLLHEASLARTRPHRALLLAAGAGSLGVAYLRWRL
jgi:hypothetical protein